MSKLLEMIKKRNLNFCCKKCGHVKCCCKRNKQKRDLLLGVLAVAAVGGAAYYINQKRKEKPLPVADHVDLDQYMGTWYEIARLPTRHEKNTKNNAAHYSLNEKGYVDVVNTAVEYKNGEAKDVSVKGKAFVMDKETNAKLKVSFFPPFCSKYWIVDVAEDYSWAIVGAPDRESFWILSRKRQLDKKVLSKLLNSAHDLGFDIENLVFTRHDNVIKEKSNREKVADSAKNWAHKDNAKNKEDQGDDNKKDSINAPDDHS